LIKMAINSNISNDIKVAFSSIDSASRRIIRTIDMILNMSELQVGSYHAIMKFVNIEEDIIRKLYYNFLPAAEEKNLKLSIKKFSENLNVFVDEYSVTQIFTNLLDNAIKYTNEGFVDIIIDSDLNEKLMVSIVDSGIGISEEYLKKLFLPFSQEEQGYTRTYDGNGLGLALVKKYCDLNAASITIKSEKSKGSTFTVIFN